MRKAEIASITVSIITAVGVMASTFWVANISPYLLGAMGGILHAIAAHENGMKLTWVKTIQMAVVSLFGGWVAYKLSMSISWLKEYVEVAMVASGFLSWELLMVAYDKKDSLAGSLWDKVNPIKRK